MNLILYLPYVKYLALIIMIFICLFNFLKFLLLIPGSKKLGRVYSKENDTKKKHLKVALILFLVIIIYAIILYLFQN